jgi:hypothetical protein
MSELALELELKGAQATTHFRTLYCDGIQLLRALVAVVQLLVVLR